MNAKKLSNQTEFTLHPHELVELDHLKPGTGIECKQGILWLTCDGDIKDYVLEPGQRYQPKGHGRVVIEAMRESFFTMSKN